MQEIIQQKMTQMRLSGMAHAYRNLLESGKHQDLTHDELISLLLQSEWEEREGRKAGRSLKQARFRYPASIQEIDFSKNRGVDKTLLLRLSEGGFVKRKEDILITGATGAGKSFIASALGHQACQLGYKVMYQSTQKLFARLKMAKGDGTYGKEISKIEKQDLLLIDDFGLSHMDHYQREALMEIMEDRHGRKSTIIASQLPVSNWYEVIGESTLADAILDRLIHKAHRIELTGESMRKKQKEISLPTEE
jgi:DNA replication protein DnaC